MVLVFDLIIIIIGIIINVIIIIIITIIMIMLTILILIIRAMIFYYYYDRASLQPSQRARRVNSGSGLSCRFTRCAKQSLL